MEFLVTLAAKPLNLSHTFKVQRNHKGIAAGHVHSSTPSQWAPWDYPSPTGGLRQWVCHRKRNDLKRFEKNWKGCALLGPQLGSHCSGDHSKDPKDPGKEPGLAQRWTAACPPAWCPMKPWAVGSAGRPSQPQALAKRSCWGTRVAHHSAPGGWDPTATCAYDMCFLLSFAFCGYGPPESFASNSSSPGMSNAPSHAKSLQKHSMWTIFGVQFGQSGQNNHQSALLPVTVNSSLATQ